MKGKTRGPSLVSLAREALVSAMASKISTTVTSFIVAAMCVSVIVTVGRANAAEMQVGERLDSAGAREMRISTNVPDVITQTMVDQLSGLSIVEEAVGVGPTVDVTNRSFGLGSVPSAATVVASEIAELGTIVDGRSPGPNEAVVTEAGMRSLSLESPYGTVISTSGGEYAIVGKVEVEDPFNDLGSVLIYEPSATLSTIILISIDASNAGEMQRQALRIVSPPNPSDLRVQSPVSLAEIRSDVVGDLSVYGRSLLLLTLGAGALLVGGIVLSDTLMRRSDLGRRRALGAPRWALITVVVGRTAIAACIGSVLGVGAALLYSAATGVSISLRFAIGAGFLSVLTAVVVSIGPAALSAWRDPVRVLRTA